MGDAALSGWHTMPIADTTRNTPPRLTDARWKACSRWWGPHVNAMAIHAMPKWEKPPFHPRLRSKIVMTP